jgi:hypothetical protein
MDKAAQIGIGLDTISLAVAIFVILGPRMGIAIPAFAVPIILAMAAIAFLIGAVLIASAIVPTNIPLWMRSRKWASTEIVTKILPLNPLDAYWKKDDPQHTERVEYVKRLYAIAYPSKTRRAVIRTTIATLILVAVMSYLWLLWRLY